MTGNHAKGDLSRRAFAKASAGAAGSAAMLPSLLSAGALAADAKGKMPARNTVVRISSGLKGEVTPGHFQFRQEPIPEPKDGEVLFRAIYMSIDAGMASALSRVGQPGGFSVGDPMIVGKIPPQNGWTGGLVGQVVTSRHADFKPGDFVHGGVYWQTYHVAEGRHLVKLDPKEAPLPTYLGLLGQNGFVGWCGVRHLANLKPGETMVVSAAGGAIGQIAGQLGKISGAQVVGIASGDKVRHVVDELGFDACIDRKTESVSGRLKELCPKGIDVYFENVGGDVGRAAYDQLASFGRMIVCGFAAEYGSDNKGSIPTAPILGKNLRILGFVIYDYYDQFEKFYAEMLGFIRDGRIKFRQDILQGLEAAPGALRDTVAGRNRGKFLIQLSPDPTVKT